MDSSDLRRHFIEALYETLEGVVSPTPLLQVTEESDRVGIRFLNGRGQLPQQNTREITVLDLDIASLFFDDFGLLYEGVTGVGKTYTIDALFQTLCGSDGYYTVRLGGGLLGASPLEPFTTTRLENGIPKIHVDPVKCQKYGALFLDEINRGDPNEVFQVVDGIIHINGDKGYLRLPIPETDRFKRLALIAAMNPPDAQHRGALELDIAGENRFLKFQFPNGIDEVASSQLEKRMGEGLHAKFWEIVRARTGLTGDWKALYPVITDPETVRTKGDSVAREFLDVALGYVGKDPQEIFTRNKEVLEACGYTCSLAVARNNDLERVRQAQKQLKHGFVRRDLQKIADLSALLGFIGSVKDKTYAPRVSLHDTAVSMGIVLESKKVTGAPEGALLAVVNDALHAYRGICSELNIPAGLGVREAVWQAAVYAGASNGYDGYQNTVKKSIAVLNKPTTKVTETVLRSRLAADLAVLDHFSTTYKEGVEKLLRSERAHEAFTQLYEQRKKESSLYQHRMNSFVQ